MRHARAPQIREWAAIACQFPRSTRQSRSRCPLKWRRRSEYCWRYFPSAPLPSHLSILLKTMMVGLPSAPISDKTSLTAAICSAACGWLTSTTCSSNSACTTSSSVALKASTRPCGSLRMKSHRVSQEYVLIRRQPQPPRGRVQRGEQFVLRQRVRAGQRVEQGGFAGVGVADDRGQRPKMALPAAALRGPMPPHGLEVLRDFFDPLLHAAAV